MTDALNKLIEAVEVGAHSSSELLAMFSEAMPQDVLGCTSLAWQAYNHGDLTAAKALHDALLPGWRLNILREDDETSSGWLCHLVERNRRPLHTVHVYDQPNPARAWLLAILRAYAGQQEATP